MQMQSSCNTHVEHFGVLSPQCEDCGGWLRSQGRGKSRRCIGCALLDKATWQINRPDGCWSWCAARRGPYGIMRVDCGLRNAHRIAFATWSAPLFPFWDVLHADICSDLACINPDHIEIGRQADRLGTNSLGYAHREDLRKGSIRPGGSRVWGAKFRMPQPDGMAAA